MGNKVLVVGGGGREHAIVDALARSAQVEKIYCAPGNAGIAGQAECVPLKDTDVEGLLAFASAHSIDLTVVGPEAALAAGIVDRFRAAGLKIFGHTKAATAIESSKDFAKQLMVAAGVPTAAYRTFTDFEAALAYVKAGSIPTVIKYDGLAAGKGVGTNCPNTVGDGVAADKITGDHLQRAELWIEKHTVATGMITVSTGHVDGFQRTAVAGIAIHNPRITGDGDGSQRVVAEAITAQGA